MRRARPASLTRLIAAVAVMVVCWWGMRTYPHYRHWALVVMGIGFFAFAKMLFGLLVGALSSAQQINYLHEARMISGGFGQARLAQRADPFIKTLMADQSGLPVGIMEGQRLFYDPFKSGNGHMLTYAPARTGKTTSCVVPALLHWLRGSMMVTDVKGELTRITSSYRRAMSQRVLILDPFRVSGIAGVRFNPLRILVDDILKNQGKELNTLARLIALQLIPERAHQTGDGVFFRNGGRRLITTFLLYLAVLEPEKCTLPGLRRCLWSSDEQKLVIAAKMQGCTLFGGLLRDYGNALFDGLAPEYVKTFGAFRDNAIHALEIFDAHSEFGQSLLESDFTLDEVLDGRTTLYVILPESKLETHGAWMVLIATLLFETIAARPKPTRILMLLEEMGNLGRLPNINKALSLLPGKGVRCWMIFQSRRQPIEIYGPHLAGLIEEQSSLMQAWSIRGEQDRKAWSARIGNRTLKGRSFSRDADNPLSPWRLNVGERGFPVLSPDQIGRMKPEDQLIALDGKPVIRAQRRPYFTDRLYLSRIGKAEKNLKNRCGGAAAQGERL